MDVSFQMPFRGDRKGFYVSIKSGTSISLLLMCLPINVWGCDVHRYKLLIHQWNWAATHNDVIMLLSIHNKLGFFGEEWTRWAWRHPVVGSFFLWFNFSLYCSRVGFSRHILFKIQQKITRTAKTLGKYCPCLDSINNLECQISNKNEKNPLKL